MSQRAPTLLTAYVVVIVQEVVFHLRGGGGGEGGRGRKAFSTGRTIEMDAVALTKRFVRCTE